MTRLGGLATYNPHLLARDELVASFIARRALLDELVDDLVRGAHQHHLLVGVRGAGKTTVLLRLAIAIEEHPKLRRTAVPLRFPEEQYNVARLSDFWLNCLDALRDAIETSADAGTRGKLEQTVAAIEPLPEEERSVQALGALTAWARKARKTLVLLVDNLDLILDRLRDSQWALREALSGDNRLVLIGTTSRFVDDAIAYDSPLYDFFRMHELGQISEDEARRVVAQLAELSGHARVPAILESDPGRFKALYVLTGGMPRMLVLLSQILALDAAPVTGDLERMLDQLTPYYKARFDELPAQSQIVVDTVALHWHPITAAECAERTRLDVKLVSAQLARLVQHGLLAKTSLHGSSKLGYLVAERFFNIWYLMRASRRVRQKLAWFVEFLRVLYSEQELERRAQELLERASEVHDPTGMLAFAAAVPDAQLRWRLEARAAAMLAAQIPPREIRELLDLDGGDAHLGPVLDRARTLHELRARLSARPKFSELGRQILAASFFSLQEKASHIRMLLEGDPPKEAVQLIAERIGFNAWIGDALCRAISAGELPSLVEPYNAEDLEAALSLSRSPFIVASFVMRSALEDQNAPIIHLARCMIARDHRLVTMALLALAPLDGVSVDRWKLLARYMMTSDVRERAREEWLVGVLGVAHAFGRRGEWQRILELFEEIHLPEVALPLYEALRAAATGNDHLDHLAPEVRIPALQLLERLRKYGEEVQQATASSRVAKRPSAASPAASKPSQRRRTGAR